MPTTVEADPEIRDKVLQAIAQALDLGLEEIDPDASLEEELGAESLDFLDLAFILERELKVRLPRRNVLERAEEQLGHSSLIQAGKVTDLGLRILRQTMPEVDQSRLQPGLRAAEIGSLLTARTFFRLAHQLIVAREAQAAEGCQQCGGALEPAPRTPELVCQQCGQATPLAPGDEVLTSQIAALDLETIGG